MTKKRDRKQAVEIPRLTDQECQELYEAAVGDTGKEKSQAGPQEIPPHLKESHLLKVIRGEAPSLFWGDRFMTDAAKEKMREAEADADDSARQAHARKLKEHRESGAEKETQKAEVATLRTENQSQKAELATLKARMNAMEQDQESLRGRVTSKSVKAGPDLTDALITRIKRDNPGISIEDICKKLDTRRGGVPLPEKFQKLGFTSWHDIWLDKKYRNRVKREISSVRAAKRPRTHEHTTAVTGVT